MDIAGFRVGSSGRRGACTWRHGTQLAVVTLTLVATTTSAPALAAPNDPSPPGAQSTAVQNTPAKTGWVAYTPGSAGSVQPQATREEDCPAGTTSYTGASQPYSCITVYLDGAGNQIGLRQGRSGPENSAFGLLHALIDHNVDQATIGFVVGYNQNGISQGNNRYLYGATDYNLDPPVSVEIYQSRAASTAAPDNYFLGVVTAYCPGQPNNLCPDEINDHG